jgi:GNAT superfamily N-acetyltransferase
LDLRDLGSNKGRSPRLTPEGGGIAVIVRRLSADDWEIDRELRLSALRDAPTAFGSTLEETLKISNDEWRERLAVRVRYHAQIDGVDIGAIGVIPPDETGIAQLVGMWVAPAARGKGAGDALVQTVLAWAREAGAAGVHLWVTKGNLPAERLYARNGFVLTGEEQAIHPDDPDRTEIGMRCELTP